MQLFGFDGHDDRVGNQLLAACWLFSQQFETRIRQIPSWRAYCKTCGSLQEIECGADDAPVDLREGLLCRHCGLNARIRAAFGLLGDLAGRDVYITEQTTPAFVWLQQRCSRLRGSEFEPDAAKREALGAQLQAIGGEGPVEFEDVTRLTHADGSLDSVVSFDVLEHVPDYRGAFSEFARVLKPGGTLVATFPFTDGATTLVRATIDASGELVHLMEPEYHGDPISGGVLCFHHFGWDVLDTVREVGFSQARMVMPWAPEQGLFYGLWTLVATR